MLESQNKILACICDTSTWKTFARDALLKKIQNLWLRLFLPLHKYSTIIFNKLPTVLMRECVKYSKAFLSVNIKTVCCVSPIPDDTAFTLSEKSAVLPQFQL